MGGDNASACILACGCVREVGSKRHLQDVGDLHEAGHFLADGVL